MAWEAEVLHQIALPLFNREIARELWVGVTTSRTHLTRILMTLGRGDRVQAVALAHESGLVAPAGEWDATNNGSLATRSASPPAGTTADNRSAAVCA
ncbi:MAG: LuxR C-terminal-related transcriptional regulator [Nostocoides sp.]